MATRPEAPAADRRQGLRVVLAAWLLFAATSPGGLEISDAELRFATARSWAQGEGGALEASLPEPLVRSPRDGRLYAPYGPLQSVVMWPWLALARHLPLGPALADQLARTWVSIVVLPGLAALALVLCLAALRRLGASPREALVGVAALGTGTLFWAYARSGQEEQLVSLGCALWLLGSALLLQGRGRGLVWSAAGGAVALATRWSTAPALLVMGLATLGWAWGARARLRPLHLGASAALVVGSLAALLGYNVHRFGSALETGYGLWFAQHGLPVFDAAGTSTQLARAVRLLVSPGYGIFWFCPLVLLALLAVWRAPRGPARPLTAVGLGALLASLALVSGYTYWQGGSALWPRYLVSPLTLLAPALALLPRLLGRATGPVLVGAALLQLPATLAPTMRETFVVEQRGGCGAWDPTCSALVLRAAHGPAALSATLTGAHGTVRRPGAQAPGGALLETSDFRAVYWWPVRVALQRGVPGAAGLALGALLLAMAAGLGAAAWRRAPAHAGGTSPPGGT